MRWLLEEVLILKLMIRSLNQYFILQIFYMTWHLREIVNCKIHENQLNIKFHRQKETHRNEAQFKTGSHYRS